MAPTATTRALACGPRALDSIAANRVATILMRVAARRRHEQEAVEQLVPGPVVGKLVEHVDRKAWHRQWHDHSLIARRR